MNDRAHLEELAGLIADGERVDWKQVKATAPSVGESQIVSALEVLDHLAGLHRELIHGATADRSATVWGHLTLHEKIGEGSFGDVYRAWDPKLHRDVALKLLSRDYTTASALSSVVIEEGRLLARVRHPNVITVFGADRFDGHAGVWMEFIHGLTLDDLVRRLGPFSAREAALIGTAVCAALAAVHRVGVTHGDVKAHNVMREHGGRIVVMDFGAGHEAADDGVVRDCSGTPLYLAPEVIRGETPNRLCDIYSLGILLYYLVTADYPVRGTSFAEIAAAHASGDRTYLYDARPDLPDRFRTVVERAISVQPADRFRSMGELGRALEIL
jgi:serine/threonine protein kinase